MSIFVISVLYLNVVIRASRHNLMNDDICTLAYLSSNGWFKMAVFYHVLKVPLYSWFLKRFPPLLGIRLEFYRVSFEIIYTY